ncbi:MAG TPA: hypothetical protein VD927_10120 [Chryseosolibacter sp.]|nr:hypothetical protein [Chryseosolibacter sp.]
MKLRLLFVISSALLTCAHAQFVVSENAVMTAANNPIVSVSTPGTVINNSDYRFDNVRFYLNLTVTDSDQTVSGNWSLFNLQISGGGETSLSDTMEVTNSFTFMEGTLKVNDKASLVYSGSADNAKSANELSYVIGPVTQRGPGPKFYPIGTEMAFAWIEFLDIEESIEDVTVEAFDDVGMTTTDPSLRILQGYWNIEISDPSKINSQVRLPLPLTETLGDDEDAVVLQTDNQLAINLGSIPGSNLSEVISASPVTSKVVAVGATTEIDITIHELITPHGSPDVFDQLEIHNLTGFAYNKVTLLDRYGVPLKEWEDYAASDHSDFFKTLSPGNYICIVEYGASKENVRKKSQMVTVLKSR